MYAVLQVVAVMLVALTAALSVAHALELPGKLRLDKDMYLAVQKIYYPGFTIGGVAEPVGTLAIIVLLIFTPFGAPAFWLILLALLGMLGVMAVYWLFTHPINQHWLKDEPLGKFGLGFFRAGSTAQTSAPAWQQLRDTWEYSHVARSLLATISLLSLVISLVV